MNGYLRSWGLSLVIAAALLAPGATAWAHGPLHTRIELLSERIAAAPTDKQLYVARAELEAEHGDMRAAEADLTQARRIDPAWAEVDLVRARCLLRSGKLDAAQVSIAAFRTREPNSLEGVRVAGEISYRLKNWVTAESLYTQFVSQAERTEPDHYLRAAEAAAQQGKEGTARALSLLDAGVAKLGDAPVLRERAIQLAVQADDHEEALRRVDAALAAAHHPERWLALRGDILCKLGQSKEAKEAYRASLEAIAKRSQARRGSALVDLRKRVEASLALLSSKGERR